jgi:NAD(P)-dependent dehydrogenase (short-subunit alcohol dehydrogenase family)
MSHLFDLTGKVAVVTGGAGGIGRAQALGLADAGAAVVVASRKLEHLENVADEIKAKGRQSLAVTVNVTDEKSVVDLMKCVLDKFPHIDILVNAAGIAIRKPAEIFPIDEWQQVLDVNTRGTFLCCQAAGRVMIKQKYGKIVNIASINGIGAFPERDCYGSAKAGVMQLT